MIASFYDNYGKLFIDCSECSKDSCSQAWKGSHPFTGGCYNGQLQSIINKNSISSLAKTETRKST